jgi:hypothetical protein
MNTSEPLHSHPFFTSWRDPQSGVETFILTERVAPVQQTFYYVNSGVTPDEKWLWFYTAFPPALGHRLGCVSLDPEHPVIRHFPAVAHTNNDLPLVSPGGDGVYFCAGKSVWFQPMEGEPKTICTLDPGFVKNRPVRRLATHLTLSADGKRLLLDGMIGNHWFVAVADVLTGEIKVLHEFGRHYNHAQFSPLDPDLFLIAQDWWFDAASGQYFSYDHRMWLMDTNGKRFEALRPADWNGHNCEQSHEWWSPQGKVCWVDYKLGAFECDLANREPVHVWKTPLCHAHSDTTARYWCADQSPYTWNLRPCEVLFFDRQTERTQHIASALPHPPYDRGTWHIDPHPRFTPRDTYISYTTTVRGLVDVALAPVRSLTDN